jgi:hydroxymethylbilane synthase
MNMERMVIGTRGSELALVQASTVEAAVRAAFPGLAVERRVIKTTGDRRTDVALAEVARAEGIVDKGVFIKELEVALGAGEIDLAVHSLKDVPTVLDGAFELAAVLERAPVRDVVVTRGEGGLAALPAGAVVGTSSVRRAFQLQWLRPDLAVADIRGNVPTRLAKLAGGEYDAVLLAEAGLVRLGHDMVRGIESCGVLLRCEPMDEGYFFPAAGQGAIGLEIRSGDGRAAAVAAALNHAETWRRVRAEREFLRLLEAGCHTPVGVRTAIAGGTLRMEARVFPEGGGEPATAAAAGPVEGALELAARLHAAIRGTSTGDGTQP